MERHRPDFSGRCPYFLQWKGRRNSRP